MSLPNMRGRPPIGGILLACLFGLLLVVVVIVGWRDREATYGDEVVQYVEERGGEVDNFSQNHVTISKDGCQARYQFQIKPGAWLVPGSGKPISGTCPIEDGELDKHFGIPIP